MNWTDRRTSDGMAAWAKHSDTAGRHMMHLTDNQVILFGACDRLSPNRVNIPYAVNRVYASVQSHRRTLSVLGPAWIVPFATRASSTDSVLCIT